MSLHGFMPPSLFLAPLKPGRPRADTQPVTPRDRDALIPTTLVTALIADRPTCLDCIARHCSLSLVAAETVLTVIQRALEVHRRDSSPCALCDRRGVVFSVERPSDGPR